MAGKALSLKADEADISSVALGLVPALHSPVLTHAEKS